MGPIDTLRHPNYAVVVGEIASLPLAFGEIRVAVVFSILNAGMLAWRISAEEKALLARRSLLTGADLKAPRGPQATVSPHIWVGFLAMCVGMFMAILDIQIVASSLTNRGNALKIAPNQLSWIQTSYLIAEIVAIPLTGCLRAHCRCDSSSSPQRSEFSLASLACAASVSETTLIAARIVQGFCGAC